MSPSSAKPRARLSGWLLLLIPIGIVSGWYGCQFLSVKIALSKWAPEKAVIEAKQDIQKGTLKTYIHGALFSSPVGIEPDQVQLISHLPTKEAGVGCVIKNMEIREAQGEYAAIYNKIILEHLKRNPPGT